MSSPRHLIAALLLVAAIVVTRHLPSPNVPAFHRPMGEFPAAFASWHSRDLPYEADIVEAIGADDYINRVYSGGTRPIELYIGYYQDQRSGDRIHSPKNCLPGSGWEPLRSGQVPIGMAEGRPILVNEYLVEQDSERDLVLYWYQTRRRIIASEYWAKYWLVIDGLKDRSTDGTLVRVWTSAADGEDSARARATDFAGQIYRKLAELLPDGTMSGGPQGRS